MPPIDFDLIAYGSLWLLKPNTQAAKDWIEENVGGEPSWLGNSLAIEHRYVEDIYRGVTNAGLNIFVAV